MLYVYFILNAYRFSYFFTGEGDESHSEKVDTDDEGIEQDHDDFENRGQSPHGGQSQSQHGGQSQHNRGQSPHVPSECLRSTLGLCQSHLSVESEAEDHYRNVNFFIIFY